MEIYQSPCHNYLEPITSIITIIPKIVLVFMHQLALLKQVINIRLPRDIHLESHFAKKINTNTSYPCFKRIGLENYQNNNLDHLKLNY